jgi:hypothetical protein
VRAPRVFDEAAQVDARDQTHVDEQSPVDFAVVVDGDYVWFAQPGGEFGFPPKSCLVVPVTGQVGGQAFERHGSFAGDVVGAVDLAHPAAPDELLEPVGPELFVGRHRTPESCVNYDRRQ